MASTRRGLEASTRSIDTSPLRVGRHVAQVLENEGHDVVAIARSKGVDLTTGEVLAEALAGATTVVDAGPGWKVGLLGSLNAAE